MLGYKAFKTDKDGRIYCQPDVNKYYYKEGNSRMIARDMQLVMGFIGLHFCEYLEELKDCYYYDFWDNEIHEVEALDTILKGNKQYCTNELKIGRKISNEEKVDILMKSDNYFAKKLVAEYEQCPGDILSSLSKDKNESVRCEVAYNTNCPEYILIELSKDKDADVRYAVAFNIKCPETVLIALSKDKDEDVRIAAKNNLKGK